MDKLTQPIETWLRTTGYFNVIAYVGIGIPVLTCLLLRFTRRKLNNEWIDRFLVLGCLLVFITSKFFPWKIVRYTFLNAIQFPYRLYSYAIPILTIGIFMMCAEIFEKRKVWGKFAYLLIVLLIIYCGQLQNKVTDYSPESADIQENYFEIPENTFFIGAGEWLPMEIKAEDVKGWERVVQTKDGRKVLFEEGYNSIVFDTIDEAHEYKIPKIYYKGYSAKLIDNKGIQHELPIHTDKNNRGEFWIDVPQELSGEIIIWYQGTMLQKMSMVISIITVLGVLVSIILKEVNNEPRT